MPMMIPPYLLFVPCRVAAAASSLRRLSDLILGPGVEIAGVMALVELARRITGNAVDHAPALDGRAFCNLVGPALHVLVFVHGEEFARAIDQALGERAIPGPGRHVGDRVLRTREIFIVSKVPVEHIELAF